MFDWITAIISTISGIVIAKIWWSRHKCPDGEKITELEDHNGLLQYQLHYEREKNKVRDGLLELVTIEHTAAERILSLKRRDDLHDHI